MNNFWQRLVQYCKSLGVTGGLLTLLGLAPLVVDDILRFYFNIQLNIPSWVVLVWFVIAFAIANLRVFEGHQGSRLELHPKEFRATLNGNWLIHDANKLVIAQELNVMCSMIFDVYNPTQNPTVIKMEVCSIDCDWHISTPPSTIRFKFGTDRHESDELRLPGLEGDEKKVSFTVTFSGPDDKSDFGYLGLLSKLIVGLTIEQRNYKKRNLTIPFDISGIHRAIEEQLLEQGLRKIVKPHDSRVANPYVLDQAQISVLLNILKEYWGLHKTQ